MTIPAPRDDQAVALMSLVARTGAGSLRLWYTDGKDRPDDPDDPDVPLVWVALALFPRFTAPDAPHPVSAVTAGLSPRDALAALADRLLDGGMCQHCGRTSAVNHDFRGEVVTPTGVEVCVTTYDPELKTYRRDCAGT